MDRHQIADTLARFCERIDEYDIDGAVEVFTEDCVTDYGPGRGGPIAGREQLRRRLLRSQRENKRTHHQLGQVTVRLDGDEARSIAYVTAWHELRDGRSQVARLQYRDRLVRRAGSWLIAERVALATGLDGFDPGDWNFLARRTPSVDPAE